MSRILVFAFLGILFINTSCERCKRCRYSYTETIIVTTPDGEVEEQIEHTDLILLDAEGEPYGDECLKYEEYKENDANYIYPIETYYELEKATTTLANFEYICTDL